MKKALKVKGMHCKSCEALLKEVVEETGAKNVSASTSKGEIVAEFADDAQLLAAKKAIQGEGYQVQ
ncbi:MAG: heavy metal-associated domain-containing protein [Candidatus Diapherotrites archaeon]